MVEPISLMATNAHGAPPAQRYSYKLDAPLADFFAWEPRENKLVERVAEARAAGLSYGCYMAMLHERDQAMRQSQNKN